MSFSGDLDAFARKADRRAKDIFVASTVEVRRSVVEGSRITGAPGQPVDTGALRASWIDNFTSKTAWQIATNLE